MTPQIRSRQYLTDRGYLIDTVERKKEFPDKNRLPCAVCKHQPSLKKSVDLFNFADVIAVHPQKKEIILVQSTDRSDHSKRRNKILASMEAKLCLMSGLRILLQSWKKNEARNRWEVAEEWFTLADYKQAISYPDDVATLMEIKRKAKKSALPPGSTIKFDPESVRNLPF